LRALSSHEVRSWFCSTQNDPNDLRQFLEMIKWALGFSAVYGISEGNNRANMPKDLCRNSLIWIECKNEHFEKEEHKLLNVLIEGAVENYIRGIREKQNEKSTKQAEITIAHLFPPSTTCSGIPLWVKESADEITHIYVNNLYPNRSLSQVSLSWVAESSSLWVIGEKLALKNSIHSNWLTEKETIEINRLETGQLWVKSREKDEVILARVSCGKTDPVSSQRFRRDSARRRRLAPVRQMSAALDHLNRMMKDYKNLYQMLCDRDVLTLGWLKVKGGEKKSQGIDGITIEMFKEHVEEELIKLSKELDGKSYRSKPLRRVRIIKPDGSERPIGIASIRDRVVQAACLTLLEPVFEPTFSHYSFAFRPRRNAHQALAFTKSIIAGGMKWAVIADIKGCFDNIDHDLLIELISCHIEDPALINLIKHWLTADVLDFRDLLPSLVGVPQGESLSPLFANVYLTPLDRHFEEMNLDFVRYADDMVIFTGSEDEAKKALHGMEQFLRDRLKLELKPSKTNYVLIENGFNFLGFTINKAGLAIKSNKIDSIKLIIYKFMKNLGDAASTMEQNVKSIMRLNSIIRGFRNYFMIPDEIRIAEQMRALDDHVEQMANFYLKMELKEAPVWICREKFYIDRDARNSEILSAESRTKTGNGYPEIEEGVTPAGWLLKDDRPEDNTTPIKKHLCAKSLTGGNENAERDSEDPSIVIYSNRLYIFVHGSFLTASDNELIIRKGKAEIFRHPINKLELVFMQGYGINLSVALQLRMAELDIPMVFAPPVGEPLAVLNPIGSRRAFLRGSQVLRRDNPDVVKGGLDMIAAKVGNQAAVLKYFSKYKKRDGQNFREGMKRAAEEIRPLLENILMLDPSQASIRSIAMGFEGQAASIYWRQFGQITPGELGFIGRVTKSAIDPVNQCLNYTYGMLYGEVWRAIAKEGLDPFFGIMHGAERNNGSLVFDLIEEFRAPFADRVVLGMLGRGFKPEIGEHGFLKTKSKRQLAVSFSKRWSKVISWRSQKISPDGILQKQAKSLAGLFKGEEVYHPFKMRW
jgi:group II intron reverse transcriptase/maturase/CRISPR-associated endonuclease Cas1